MGHSANCSYKGFKINAKLKCETSNVLSRVNVTEDHQVVLSLG